jgi:hypothetical protein
MCEKARELIDQEFKMLSEWLSEWVSAATLLVKLN